MKNISQKKHSIFSHYLPSLVVGILVVIISNTVLADCEHPPKNQQLELINNGTEVKDNTSGLIWQRCSLGQTWDGTNCTGKATNINWLDAMQQAKAMGNGYRLPSIKELVTLAEFTCEPAAIHPEFFPNTMQEGYFSNTPAQRKVEDSDFSNEPSIYTFNFSPYFTGIGSRPPKKQQSRVKIYARAVRVAP